MTFLCHLQISNHVLDIKKTLILTKYMIHRRSSDHIKKDLNQFIYHLTYHKEIILFFLVQNFFLDRFQTSYSFCHIGTILNGRIALKIAKNNTNGFSYKSCQSNCVVLYYIVRQ